MILLLFAEPHAAAALVLEAWSQQTCAASSTSEDFDSGCRTGAGITASTDSKGSANPGDSIASVAGASASLPATLDSNQASATAQSELDGIGDGLATGASATLTLTLRNDAPAEVPFSFGLEIKAADLMLKLEDFVAAPDEVAIAEVYAAIWCDSCVQESFKWSYKALLAGPNFESTIGLNDLQDFWDPQQIGKPSWTWQDSGRDCLQTPPDCTRTAEATLSSPFNATLAMGDVGAGETVTVRYLIRARVYTGLLDSGQTPVDPPQVDGAASFFDPFGAGDVVFIDGVPLSTLVPEADALPAAASALATLVALRRSRRGSRRGPR